MTRKYFKASMAALAALLAIACSEKTLDYKDLGFSRADYSGVPEGEALTLTADMAQSDFFETTVLKVSGLASECVLYAYKADGTKLFGPEDLIRAF